MNLGFVTLLLTLLNSNLVMAHGMNKLGPNGGYIKMPGALHTELVDKESKMHVYLLDMNFKNPTIENSTVKIKYKGAAETEYSCVKSVTYFICDKPNASLKKYNEVVVSAVRKGIVASNAIYTLPLKLD